MSDLIVGSRHRLGAADHVAVVVPRGCSGGASLRRQLISDDDHATIQLLRRNPVTMTSTGQ